MILFISATTNKEKPSFHNTMTVGELKNLLNNYEDDTKIYLKEKNNSMSFSTMNQNNITTDK